MSLSICRIEQYKFFIFFDKKTDSDFIFLSRSELGIFLIFDLLFMISCYAEQRFETIDLVTQQILIIENSCFNQRVFA
jgi:hypothetical protein